MTVATRIDWDQWRANYDRMTFREHQEFNATVADQHPVQQQFNAMAVASFLDQRKPAKVVEVGGWCGSLAAAMLAEFDFIKTWVNYDITPNVPQLCDDPRYHKVTLIDWPWKCAITGDAMIASHVLEHMRLAEVAELVQTWTVDSIYADVPLRASWDGYEGSHILEADADDLLDVLCAAGFDGGFAETRDGIIAFLDRA